MLLAVFSVRIFGGHLDTLWHSKHLKHNPAFFMTARHA